ncbi:MAG: PhzF family phenazine biosynthesis protein [Pseudomonadota bacterium]
MQERRFIQCDVFSPVAGFGNALAVVLDGSGLDDSQMQRFAAWTNLAETTFILPPEDKTADYRLKIFSPGREMLFAGHPTLGSCMSWLHSGGEPRNDKVVRQECGVGIVEIDISNPDMPSFTAPPTKIRPMQAETFGAITDILEISPRQILAHAELDNGPVWQVFQLDSAESVLKLDATRVRWPEFKALGFIGAQSSSHECDYEVRMLAPSSGMSEDPITGSLNSALSHWMMADGRIKDTVVVAQGANINRKGRVTITPGENMNASIGGQVHMIIEGSLLL